MKREEKKKNENGALYEPAEGKYHLPIYTHDVAVPAMDWQYLIDVYVANYGHKPDPELFRQHIDDLINEIRENAMSAFFLCKDRIMEEISEQ